MEVLELIIKLGIYKWEESTANYLQHLMRAEKHAAHTILLVSLLLLLEGNKILLVQQEVTVLKTGSQQPPKRQAQKLCICCHHKPDYCPRIDRFS